jgi:hypothetical protein
VPSVLNYSPLSSQPDHRDAACVTLTSKPSSDPSHRVAQSSPSLTKHDPILPTWVYHLFSNRLSPQFPVLINIIKSPTHLKRPLSGLTSLGHLSCLVQLPFASTNRDALVRWTNRMPEPYLSVFLLIIDRLGMAFVESLSIRSHVSRYGVGSFPERLAIEEAVASKTTGKCVLVGGVRQGCYRQEESQTVVMPSRFFYQLKMQHHRVSLCDPSTPSW